MKVENDMLHPAPRAPKTIAAVHDISCYGRCSMQAVWPVLSHYGHLVCPLPTALLSTHTGGFDHFTFLDLGGEMKKILASWREEGLRFDAVYSGFLGSAKFHASASFSCYNNMQPISDSSTHPLYQGEKMKIEDAVAAMGAKTVYFSGMALNEIGIFGAEASAENLASVVDAIKAKSPDVKIVILANTYMVKNFNTYQKLHNGSISEYNNLLLDYCNENGFDFVDVATPLMENGCLADKFCSDNDKSNSNCLGCHLTTDAYAIWTAVLRDYAKAERAGTYVNPDSMPLYSRG